jgi:hypothetical protein
VSRVPHDVGEREERLGLGGIWEQVDGDADAGVAGSLSGQRDERDHRSSTGMMVFLISPLLASFFMPLISMGSFLSLAL